MDLEKIWDDDEYERIRSALYAYSARNATVTGQGNAMRCPPPCAVLRYAIERFGEGAREDEIKAILLYGQNRY